MTQSWGVPPTEESWLGFAGIWVEGFKDAQKYVTKEDAEAALIGVRMTRGDQSTSHMTEEIRIVEVP